MKKIKLVDGNISYHSSFIAKGEGDRLFDYLSEKIAWQSDVIKIYGKIHKIPRLQAWYGDSDATYSYSGIKLIPNPWIPLLEEIKTKVEKITLTKFNSVLLNLYRDGQDSNGWHSDNEKQLGTNPTIASISIGQERIFHLKHRTKTLKHSLTLSHGSLLIMSGTTQHFWKHQIPKSRKTLLPRINLTFRRIFS